MHVAMPTPTEARAIERHLSFRARIAEAAERLAESKRPAPEPIAPPVIAELAPPTIAHIECHCQKCVAASLSPEAVPAEPDPPRQAYPRVEAIQREVAAYYGVSMIDMKSARRTSDVVLPRQIAMYLAKSLTIKSYPEIGRRFGGKDHSTIYHAIRKITGRLPHDADLASQVAHLFNVITGEPQ